MKMLYRNVKRGYAPDDHDRDDERWTADKLVYGEESWDGGKTWVRFSGALPLMRINMATMGNAEASMLIWPMSDYGTMDYDWSAIRDSTPHTIAEMERVAKRFLPDAEFYARLGLA